MYEDKSIYLCSFCGEKLQGKRICATCKTKEQRRAKIDLQLEIDSENFKKGRVVSNRMFMFPRQALMDAYGIK